MRSAIAAGISPSLRMATFTGWPKLYTLEKPSAVSRRVLRKSSAWSREPRTVITVGKRTEWRCANSCNNRSCPHDVVGLTGKLSNARNEALRTCSKHIGEAGLFVVVVEAGPEVIQQVSSGDQQTRVAQVDLPVHNRSGQIGLASAAGASDGKPTDRILSVADCRIQNPRRRHGY